VATNSRREDALLDLRSRVAFIEIAKGYGSDAGKAIFMGETPVFGPDDPPAALAIVVGADSPTTQGGLVRTRVPVEIQAIVPATIDDAFMALEAIVADIKRAVEIEGVQAFRTRSLKGTLPMGLERGVTRILPRDEGSLFVGTGIEYVLSFEEKWGDP